MAGNAGKLAPEKRAGAHEADNWTDHAGTQEEAREEEGESRMRARACFLEGFDRLECVIVLSGTCGEAARSPRGVGLAPTRERRRGLPFN